MRFQTVLIALVLLLASKAPVQQVFDSHVHLWEGDADLLLDLLLQHRNKLRRLSPDSEATRRVQNLVDSRAGIGL